MSSTTEILGEQYFTPTAHTSTKYVSAPDADPIAFLERRYGEQDGWCCIGSITGDPRINDMTPEWYSWPGQKAAIACRLDELISTAGNIYAAPCLFRSRKRSYRNALLSSWLWQDDAPADIDCTELVRTSEHSYQAWVWVDQALTSERRSVLQRHWRDMGRSSGAQPDDCSADAVHMTRLPGGYNTKAHGHYLVSVTIFDSTPRQLETLQRAWPTPLTDAVITPDWQQVDHWYANFSALLGKDGFPRRLTKQSQARHILAGNEPDDTSEARYIVGRGLLMHGYPIDEAATLLLRLTDWGSSARKGSDWLEADITRVLDKVAAELGGRYRPSPTLLQAPRGSAPRPHVERRKRGRPRHAPNAANYAQWLLDYRTGEDKVLGTRKENAQQLGCSLPHLDRLEKTLRDAGCFIRSRNETTTKSRRDSWLELNVPALEAFLSAIKNTSEAATNAEMGVLSEDAFQGVVVRQSAQGTLQEEHTAPPVPTEVPGDTVSPPPLVPDGATGAGCVPPTFDPTPPAITHSARPDYQERGSAPPPSELVREAFDAIQGRATLKRINRYVELNAPTGTTSSASQIATLVEAERRRRAWSRRLTAAASRARQMSREQLQRASRGYAGRAADFGRSGQVACASVWRQLAGVFAEEEARREGPPLVVSKPHGQDAVLDLRSRAREPACFVT